MTNEPNGVDINKQRRMLIKIVSAEMRNLKTDNKSDKEMKKRIIDIIESEAGKCS